MLRHEPRFIAVQVTHSLLSQEAPVVVDVMHHHFDALL
jgi:hypothetical protein